MLAMPTPPEYVCINTRSIGSRICDQEKAFTPFCLQYDGPREGATANPTHIRFVIVEDSRQEDLGEEPLVLECWVGSWGEDKDKSRFQPIRHRDVLRSRKEIHRPNANSHVLTLVYEVRYVAQGRIGFVYYPEYARSQPGTPARAIVLDHTFSLPHAPGPWTTMFYVKASTPTVVFSGLSLDWEVELKSGWMGLSRPSKCSPTVLYTTTIKPIPGSITSPWTSLPLKVLRHIALEVIKYRPPKWRAQLLVLGLVAKSWTPILDLFFKLHTSPYPFGPKGPKDITLFEMSAHLQRRPQFLKVAQSLANGRPEKALLLEKFSLANYSETAGSTSIPIDPVEFLGNKHILWALLDLTLVERCVANSSVTGYYGCDVSLGRAQQVLAQWPELRVFTWSGGWSRKKSSKRVRKGQKGVDVMLGCRLEELSIARDTITEVEFLRFFEVTSPRLTKLVLEDVDGLVNEDLHHALSMVTSSIKEIRIFGCDIPTRIDEEYALDVLISDLNNLETLVVPQDIISFLAVERKTDGPVQASLTIKHVEDPSFLEGFCDAFRLSGPIWKSIHFLINDATFTQSGYIDLEEVKSVAHVFGVNFSSAEDLLAPASGTQFGRRWRAIASELSGLA